MKWLAEMSPLRFALFLVAVFAVAASLAWSFAHERHDEPRWTPQTAPFVPMTDAPAVTTEVP